MLSSQWYKSQLPGYYVSATGTHTAELRSAGYDTEVGCKLVRHYAIRLRDHEAIIGRARTLTEAARLYL